MRAEQRRVVSRRGWDLTGKHDETVQRVEERKQYTDIAKTWTSREERKTERKNDAATAPRD